MKRFEKNRKTILFLCYLPMILFIGLLWNAASRQIHSQLFSTLADLARQNRYVVSYSINQKMEELERVAQGLAQREDFPQGVAIDDLATVANVLGFREIGVTGLDGMARMSTDTSYDITGREYFQISIQGFNWVSKTLCDMRDGKKVNVCSVPVRSDSGAVIGTLLGTIETDEFFASMQVPSFHEQGYAYVVNQDGDVVLTTRSDGVEVTNFCTLLYQNPGNVDQLNQLRDCLAGKTESVNLLVNEDERHYINVSRLGYDDLWLVTGVPEHALDSGIMTQFKVIQVLSVVFAVAGLAGLFFLNLIMDRNDRHLRKLAYVDARTGIHNHFYLRETMGKFTTLGPGKGKRVAVLLFNIQQFKNINNLYGSVAGDQVLKHVAQHLSAVFGEGRTLARDTADSFVVLSPYEDWNQLLEQAETLCADLPLLPFNNNEIGVKLRCGIYRLPDGVQPDEEALFRARMACFEAPRESGVGVYCAQVQQKMERKKEQQNTIRQAIANREFKAWLQPKFCAQTRSLLGAEALARWCRPDGSVLPPGAFIADCEEMGIIGEVDEMVLEDVCRQIRDWREQGIQCPPVSVNLSRVYLSSLDIVDKIDRVLNRYKLERQAIQLEITESALVKDEDGLRDVVERMRSLGFTIVLDDFGKGYSSLSSIHDLRFDIIKIDKSFVDRIGSEQGDQMIRFIIELVRALQLELVAEGVEDQSQYEFLRGLGCHAIQGYYFSKPLSCQDFADQYLQ